MFVVFAHHEYGSLLPPAILYPGITNEAGWQEIKGLPNTSLEFKSFWVEHCPLTLKCLYSINERVSTHRFVMALLWTGKCRVSPVWGLGTPRSSWAACFSKHSH
jgi:hypothetical protein